jgi:DNA-binding NtrC family response regulator
MNGTSLDHSLLKLLEVKYGIVGSSGPMGEAIQRLMQAAPTDLAILITGETGTGKEVFANAIHGLSNRKKFPFVSVNCGAIPETLLESELFGHEKGAFTSAVDQRKGFFEVAHKGTIFLDEIGEMPVGTQVKLLRILESGEFSRLGSSDVRRVDVRIIAATNRELEYEVREGNFRQDLYYRLNSVHIALPALRDHIEDIPVLINYYAKKTSEKIGIRYDGISQDALNVMRSLHWQGNVRELRNLVETVITLESASYILPEHLRDYIARALPPHSNLTQAPESSLVRFKDYTEPEKYELEIIFRTLLSLKNDIDEMKMSLSGINSKLDRLKTEMLELKPETPIQFERGDIPSIDEDNLNINNLEKELIVFALRKFDGNRRHVANALGISERTLYRKLSEYDLD